MKPFRDLPIQRKMLMMTIVIVGTILLVAIAALFAFQILNFRDNFKSDAETLAVVIANNSTAALAFKDASGGTEVLASLKAVPTVVSASLVTTDGSIFARFGKTEDTRSLAQFPPLRVACFTGGDLLLTQPVVLDSKLVGNEEFAIQTEARCIVLTHGDPPARAWFAEQLALNAPKIKVIDPVPLKTYQV